MTGPAHVTVTSHGPRLVGDQPVYVPDSAGVHRMQVVARSIISRQWLGEILSAVVDSPISGPDINGSGSVTLKVALDDPSIDALGGNPVTYGTDTYRQWALIDVEFHIYEDGACVGIFVAGDDVREDGSFGTIPCVTKVDGLFSGRTLGDGKSTDLLAGRGFFAGTGDLRDYGFYAIGDLEWEFTEPYGSYGRGIRYRGQAFDSEGREKDHLKIAKNMATAKTTTFHNLVRTVAFVRVPTTANDDQLVLSQETFEIGEAKRYNPPPYDGLDEQGGSVDDDTELGQYSVFTAFSQLPLGPHQAVTVSKAYPLSQSAWTYMWGMVQIQRDNLSTGVERDLVYHLRTLLRDAQDPAKGKSSWGLAVKVTGLSGIEEVGTWWREDNQPLTDALDAITSRYEGPDPVWVDFQGRARVDARRGSVRTDFVLTDDNVIKWEDWTTNVRSQVSEVRTETDLGSDYWRQQVVVRDTSRTSGHVIERITRGPNGMRLRQLEEFTKADHYQHSQPQETTRAWVTYETGYSVSVGDSFRVYREMGRKRGDRTMRVTNRTLDHQRRMIVLDLGTDEAA